MDNASQHHGRRAEPLVDHILPFGETDQELHLLAGVGRMIYGIAHDIRHHMASLHAISELVDTHVQQEPSLSKDLRELSAEICELLDLSLLYATDGRRYPMSLEAVDEIVARAVQMVRCHPHSTSVTIVIENSQRVTHNVNRTILLSAVYNLVLNACQATAISEHPGRVVISLSQNRASTVLRITDNGPGLPPQIQQALLNLSGPLCSLGQFGLGLVIAYRAACLHGGRLALEKSLTAGTVFILEMPALSQ